MSAGDGLEQGGNPQKVLNGLYIFEIEMRDGKRGQAKGVVVLCDGRIMGGDSYFYYTGSYTFRNGKWRGARVRRQGSDLRLFRRLFRRRRRSRRHGAGWQDQRDIHGAAHAEGPDVRPA